MTENSKGKILIIDDEKSIRVTLKILLENEGYSVDTSDNARDATDIFSNGVYDLVITDIVMPKITGIELLSVFKEKKPDIPVVIMTGDPSMETAVNALKEGAYDYVCKPVTKADLLNIAERAVYLNKTLEQKKLLEQENYQYRNHLENLVKKRTTELEKTAQSIIYVMDSMMELRDPYTAGHQRRVGNLAASIAKEIGLSDEISDGLRIAGYLHDIGKISVPLEILVKPSKLSPFEFEIVKGHSLCGKNLLKGIEFPWQISEIVSQHHERVDGSGYPEGLKEENILKESLILAVSDVVEAMTSHRPYRESKGLESALSEIKSNRGTKYGADAVDACVKLFDKGYIIENEFILTHFSL